MPTAGEVIRLVIVEDHVLVREGLIEILQTYEDLEVVGAAGDSGSAVAVVAKQKPDTVILDVEIPGDEVTTTVGRIQEVSPGTKILVLSMYDGPELVRHLLGLGVKGYLLKNATRHELVAAIRGAHADDGRIVLFVSRESLAHVQDGSSATLSARERDVLELVALGMSNAQVRGHGEASPAQHLREARRGLADRRGQQGRRRVTDLAAQAGGAQARWWPRRGFAAADGIAWRRLPSRAGWHAQVTQRRSGPAGTAVRGPALTAVLGPSGVMRAPRPCGRAIRRRRRRRRPGTPPRVPCIRSR